MERRRLDELTLRGAAQHYCDEFGKRSVPHPHTKAAWIGGRSYVMRNLYNLTFKDEFEFVLAYMDAYIPEEQRAEFKKACADWFEPRDEIVFEALLAEHLAINPAGEHIPGCIGKVQVGNRIVGKTIKEVPRYYSKKRTLKQRFLFLNGSLVDRMLFKAKTSPKLIEMRYLPKNEYWPVYAGEVQERLAESDVPDVLPEGAHTFEPVEGRAFATNPKISNALAILMADAVDDEVNSGSTAGNIRGRTGSQPADPDATETGTLLFTLTCSDPAFGAAADDTGKATITANSITDDTSADATGTLGYCRIAATGTGADDVADGEAGTSGSDFNFNTVSIVSGSTVSMSALTISVSE
jgi:hypothetical protein